MKKLLFPLMFLTPLVFATELLSVSNASAAPKDWSKSAVEREETVARIEHYLTAMTSLQAEFTQVAPDGSISTGTFYLKRPGKMRWQYHPPTPVLMVSDGKVLTFYDSELQQVSYVPMDETVVGFLTRETISFSDDRVKVDEFKKADGMVRISVRQAKKPEDGKLMLEFSDSPLQLRNLVITDATGQTTNVALSQARFGLDLDNGLFQFKDPRKPRRRL